MRRLFLGLVCIFIIILQTSAGETLEHALPEIPPRHPTADERLISEQELFDNCPELRKEVTRISDIDPPGVMHLDFASHSQKFGFILRYSRKSRIEMPDGSAGDVKSTVILFQRPELFPRAVIMFHGPGDL
jgi:hypothetical protein